MKKKRPCTAKDIIMQKRLLCKARFNIIEQGYISHFPSTLEHLDTSLEHINKALETLDKVLACYKNINDEE